LNKVEETKLLDIHPDEAHKLAFYLVSKSIDNEMINKYKMAVQIKQVSINPDEKKIWHLMLNYSLILASVDSCMALINRHSPIRQRICIMLAILEAHPAHITSFYKKKLHFIDHLNLLFHLVISPFKIMLGLLIIKLS